MAVIEAFNASMLPLPEGYPLGNLLCKILQCSTTRLSSKIRKGKSVFRSSNHHRVTATTTTTIGEGGSLDIHKIEHYISIQRKISDTEALFLNKIAAESDPMASSNMYTLVILLYVMLLYRID